jgi:hypothetical protein
VPDRESHAAWAAAHFHYDETVKYIQQSAAHIREICEELDLPLTRRAA